MSNRWNCTFILFVGGLASVIAWIDPKSDPEGGEKEE